MFSRLRDIKIQDPARSFQQGLILQSKLWVHSNGEKNASISRLGYCYSTPSLNFELGYSNPHSPHRAAIHEVYASLSQTLPPAISTPLLNPPVTSTPIPNTNTSVVTVPSPLPQPTFVARISRSFLNSNIPSTNPNTSASLLPTLPSSISLHLLYTHPLTASTSLSLGLDDNFLLYTGLQGYIDKRIHYRGGINIKLKRQPDSVEVLTDNPFAFALYIDS